MWAGYRCRCNCRKNRGHTHQGWRPSPPVPPRGTPGYAAPELIMPVVELAEATPRAVAAVHPVQPATAPRLKLAPITQAVDMYR